MHEELLARIANLITNKRLLDKVHDIRRELFALATIALQGQGPVYTVAMLAQIVFYGIGLLGWLSVSLRENAVVRIVYFFIQTNLALAQAFIAYLFGKRMTVWAPSQR